MLELIQESALLIGTALGAATDAKTGYIYDWITYPMIAIGFALSILQQQWNNLLIGTALFVLLYVAYKLGKLGGGDVKLFVGIALLNPYNDYNYLATTMLFAAMSAMIFYSVYYSAKYALKGINFEENKKNIIKAIFFGLLITAYFYTLTTIGLISIASMWVIIVPMFFGLVFIALQKGITKNFFEQKIFLKEIEEDEVIAKEANNEKVLKILKGQTLVGPKEAMLLKDKGIKSIYVLRRLPPFGPFILMGVLGAILMPNFFMLLFI
jgi:Flp pilus assembly protein protease CpaA